jgi:hypothetical protein
MRPKSPDAFSAHEAMDRSHLVATLFGDFVADHAFIQSNAKLKREAEAVAEALGDLYQSVGRAAFAIHHSDDTPEALAKELGISAKTVRGFLRKKFPRGQEKLKTPWHLTETEIAAVRKRWQQR